MDTEQVVSHQRTRRALVALGLALALLASCVAVADASFPGRNGLIAFAGEGPPFDTKRVPEGAWTIRVVNPHSGRTRQLTHVPRRCDRRGWTWLDSDPSYSASGRLLAYTHQDSCDPRTPDGVYIMRADGSGRRLIRRSHQDSDPDSAELLGSPAFSPSGRFVTFDDYTRTMHIIRVPRPNAPALDINCERAARPRCRTLDFERYRYLGQPSFSSKGRLAVTLTVDRAPFDLGHIGTVTPDGKDLRLVTRSRRDSNPDWSPNGDSIAFHRQTFTGRRYEGNVLTAPARGKHHRRPRRLTETGDAFFPSWSPNGRYVAYVRDQNAFLGPASLWIMRASDGGDQRLVVSGVITDKISWQPLPF